MAKSTHTSFLKLAFILLMPYLLFSQKASNAWRLYKSENGISVYTRYGFNSSYKDIKVEFTTKTSLNSVVALIYDWDAYPEWNYKCIESKTLKKISDKEVIHYQTTDLPWPVKDEDFIIKVSLDQDPVTKIVKINSVNMPNYIPPFEDKSRITNMYGLWTLIPNKDGTVHLIYEFNVQPDESIPVVLVNIAVAFGPYETISAFKTWLQKDTYQKTKLHLVKELSE